MRRPRAARRGTGAPRRWTYAGIGALLGLGAPLGLFLVRTIERRYLRAAENFGVSRFTLFRQVVIPAVLPQVLVGMRVGLGVAWLVVVAAEMIALRTGLGYLIMDSRNAGNRYDLVIAGMIIIGLIGLMLDGGMRLLEGHKLVRWRYAH